jgi:transcriptional regulator with XRE-family HTH domain/uncharacterized RmlC-like cupin family protein
MTDDKRQATSDKRQATSDRLPPWWIFHYSGIMPRSSLQPTIARRVREERKRLGLTLEQLAARASVSRGMISKIERGESSPSAALLSRLGEAMGASLSDLMTEPSAVRPGVSRLADQLSWVDPATHYTRRMVWPIRGPGEVEVVAVELPPGQTAAFAASTLHHAKEQVLLLQGELRITAGEKTFALGPGDCVLFATDLPHAYANPGIAPCLYLVLRSENVSPAARASVQQTPE